MARFVVTAFATRPGLLFHSKSAAVGRTLTLLTLYILLHTSLACSCWIGSGWSLKHDNEGDRVLIARNHSPRLLRRVCDEVVSRLFDVLP